MPGRATEKFQSWIDFERLRPTIARSGDGRFQARDAGVSVQRAPSDGRRCAMTDDLTLPSLL